ncbi:MAG: formate dehydrogenase accessory protein FdhE [Syntrophomonadaceae bacterium]|nr:formate dehydrogenase accessory protein FdhE [Syntrophomonadaceae bacterium]MDD3889717.1 formate dehydrogenase accessory protein FdhE [Syntrophomonadaceae bacterium]MDD4548166.1 formate dehydrogenase accessory protein FdhE [Syntrophomonadaceae bacterium]
MNRKVPVELPEGYVDFYKNLETWQNEQQIKLQKDLSLETADILTLIANNKKPLVKIHKLKIDIDQYKTMFINLLDFLSRVRPQAAEKLKAVYDYIDELSFSTIMAKIIADDLKYFNDLAADINVPGDLLFFVLDHALRPFLRVYAAPYQEAIANDEFQSWNFSRECPVCGSRSHFSRLRTNDGRRFMFCDRCFIEWETRYLKCVHCDNDEPGTVKYLSVENDDAYQLYVCEKCKGYLKTYDERTAGKTTDMFIANIETVYLDMLAQEKGYNNHDY